VPVEALSELRPFHHAVLEDGRLLDRVACALCDDVCRDLATARVRPSEPPEPEAYTVFCFTDLGGATNTNTWLQEQRAEVAALLTDVDPQLISAPQVDEVLRQYRSLETTDLLVIDWDAALVVDLNGYVDDVLYVLELANLQLEEFRTMDQALDRYLNTAYEHLEKHSLSLFGISGHVLRKLRWFRMDLTKLADEVTNITKFFGDWYLARVYDAARERFHLDHWRNSVEQRLSHLDQLYSVVHAENYERRMIWLEVVVAIMIAIDLIAVFWKH
jgi:hypothetical protein